MKFPIKKYGSLKSYKSDYQKSYVKSFNSINEKKLDQVLRLIEKNYKNPNRKILVCGNGGSAALANHFACDHQKILSEISQLNPYIVSLSSNSSLMTAISNDNNYESVYSDQINQIGLKNDILITISSSGRSKNIVKAIEVAKKKSIFTIGLTGFDGGKSKKFLTLIYI